MEPDKPEPGPEPIISAGTARFTVALFLALLTLEAALLIWRGLSTVPDRDHRIDQVMGALPTFSTFAAMLVVLYLVIAARVFTDRLEGQFGLRYQQGLSEGRRQAAQRFKQDACEVWRLWTEWKELADAAHKQGNPEPEPPRCPGSPGD